MGSQRERYPHLRKLASLCRHVTVARKPENISRVKSIARRGQNSREIEGDQNNAEKVDITFEKTSSG
jgi:hypothetical protein